MFKIAWDKENNGVKLTMRSTEESDTGYEIPPSLEINTEWVKYFYGEFFSKPKKIN